MNQAEQEERRLRDEVKVALSDVEQKEYELKQAEDNFKLAKDALSKHIKK